MLLLCPVAYPRQQYKYDCQLWRRGHRDLYKKAFFRGMVKQKIKQLHMQQTFLKFLLSNWLPSLTGPSSSLFPFLSFQFFTQPFYPVFLQLLFQDYLPLLLGLFLHFCFIPLTFEDTSVDPQPNSSSEGEGRRMSVNTCVLLLVSLQISHGLNQCSVLRTP